MLCRHQHKANTLHGRRLATRCGLQARLAHRHVAGLTCPALRAVFPVYFKTAVHLSPATTNAVLATTPLFLAPFSFVARYLGRHVGACDHWHSGPGCVRGRALQQP